ncbi:MAG: YsnF/AvaK domain-containing protein [Geminicoccaceae bacterium]
MTDRTLTAMYDTQGAAENVRDQLVGVGVARDAISIHGTQEGTAGPAASRDEDGGFWASLGDLFMPDEDRHTYTEGLKRGSYLLSARVSADVEPAAMDVLEGSDPIDLDERRESWRHEGWADYQAGSTSGSGAGASAAYGDATGLADAGAAPYARTTGGVTGPGRTNADTPASLEGSDRLRQSAGSEEVVQAAEEELRVGKREVGRGGVRVRSYVTERPVEEQVELRQEHVTIERRPVDREITPGDHAFEERTIEAVERGEEAVVSKAARVTEEIGLRKDVERETETVRDTVRKQEIEVEDERTTRDGATRTNQGTVVTDREEVTTTSPRDRTPD